jgi:hypothetical protein
MEASSAAAFEPAKPGRVPGSMKRISRKSRDDGE